MTTPVAFNVDLAARYAKLLRAEVHKFDHMPEWREVIGASADIIDALLMCLSNCLSAEQSAGEIRRELDAKCAELERERDALAAAFNARAERAERELLECEVARDYWREQHGQERTYAVELHYVVSKAAEWDADNTDNADLAALGAYARAALAVQSPQRAGDSDGHSTDAKGAVVTSPPCGAPLTISPQGEKA